MFIITDGNNIGPNAGPSAGASTSESGGGLGTMEMGKLKSNIWGEVVSMQMV